MDLAAAVERAAAGMTLTALQRQAGLSSRTLRELLAGNPDRRFSRSTLAKLDGPLGWAPGTAWRLYRADRGADVGPGDVNEIATQLAAIKTRLNELEERPIWAAEVVEAHRLLSSADRAILLSLARRLGGSA